MTDTKIAFESSPLLVKPGGNRQPHYRSSGMANSTPASTIIEPDLSFPYHLFQQDDLLVWFMVITSLVANIILFSAKMYVYFTSSSLAVLASAVDSMLDLISQFIVYLALNGSKDTNKEVYPVGRSRLEPVGIVVCAALMGMAALQVVYTSAAKLFTGFTHPGEAEVPLITPAIVALLITAIFIKLVLFCICYTYRDRSHSIIVLYEDHRNDVVSNFVALVTASLTTAQLWYLDPIGGIVISVYITLSWSSIAQEQIEYLVGKTADSGFLEGIRRTGNEFHKDLEVDVIRAYHFGKCYLVEVEIVLPHDMSVQQSHDIALGFQKLIEEAEEVERAFVHVDYQTRDEDEHKDPHSPLAKRENSRIMDDFPDDVDIELR